MRTSIVGLMCFLTLGYHSLTAGSNSAMQPDKKNARWGFAAAVFNLDSGELAVSLNTSRTTMLLFSVGFVWADVDRQRLNDADRNTTVYSLSAGPEIRRIYHRHPSIGLYAGLQPIIGYSLSKQKQALTDTDYRQRSLSYGVNLTLGAEYEIINNLSISVHFRPLRYVYSESKEGPASNEHTDSITKSHSVSFSQQTGLYLRIYF